MKGKYLKTLVVMLMFVVSLSVSSLAAVSLTSDKASGSTLNQGSEVRLTATTNDGVGVRSINYTMTNNATGSLIKSYVFTSSATVGNLPYWGDMLIPTTTASQIKVVAYATDVNGNRSSDITLVYNISGNGGTNPQPGTVSLTSNVGTGSTVTQGSEVRLTATNTAEIGIRSINYTMTDASTGNFIKSHTFTESKTEGSKPFWGDMLIPTTTASQIKVIAYATDVNGNRSSDLTLVYNISGNGGTNPQPGTVSLTSNVSSGSTVNQGSEVRLTATTSNGTGVRSISYTTTDASTGNVIKTYTFTSSASVGNLPYWGDMVIPTTTASQIKVVAYATDVNGNRSSDLTLIYNINGGGTNPQPGTVSLTSNVSSGSTVNQGSEVRLTGTTSNGTGVRSISYTMTNNATGAVIKTYTFTSSASVGNLPYWGDMVIPTTTASQIKVVAYATDVNGNRSSDLTLYYNVSGGSTDPIAPTITVTPNGGTVGTSDRINITIGNSVYYDRLEYRWDNKTSEYSRDVLVTTYAPSEGTHTLSVRAEYQNSQGNTLTTNWQTYTYTVEEDDDDRGSINKDLEGLVVELVTVERTNFYAVDEDIEFILYYYNADKKAKNDVKITVEIPDDFEVENRGSATLSRDELRWSIGTLEKEQLGSVRFTLRADDDSMCEEITHITAYITCKTDEEDSSTVRLMIYESGDKGTHTAFILGYPDGTFGPDNYITREEVAAMLARAFGISSYTTGKKFSDVETTSWAFNYINACTARGVITGYTDGTFKPKNNISKAELYAMAYRAMDIDPNEQALFVPSKYKKHDSWEKNYVAGLERLNMLKGMSNVDPTELATRAEVVFLINRIQLRNPASLRTTIFPDVSGHWAASDIAEAAITHTYKRSSSGKETVTY